MKPKIYSVPISFLLPFAIASANSPCPNPKIQGERGGCDSLDAKLGDAFMIFDVELTGPLVGPDSDSLNRANLKKWTTELFTKYDFRLSGDLTKKWDMPSDSDLNWNYGPINMTKNTALSVIEEPYVKRIFYYPRPAETSINGATLSGSIRIPTSDPWFDAKGRKSVIGPAKTNPIRAIIYRR